MKRTLLYIIAALTVLAFGFGTALADNGGGNGGKPKGGDNSCPPSSHEVRDAAGNVIGCEHNGDGGGNCGQNQSDQGSGGNGGDKGYGHEDGCQGTPPPPPCSVNCGPPPPCTVNCGPPPPCTVNCGPPPPCTVNCGGKPPCTVNCGGTPPCSVNCGSTTTTTQTTTPTPPAAVPPVVPPAVKPPTAKTPKATTPKAKQPVTKTKLETALRKQAKPDTTPSSEPQAAGELPRTGLPLFPLALLGGGLTGLGGWMRRRFPK